MLILGVILGLFVLVLLVVLHELGHAMVAKRNGVVVEEFGIGFPPRAKNWQPKKSFLGKNVIFSLNWLPLGGFVKLKGEYDSAEGKGTYGGATFWVKTKILLAGVLMNWLTAVQFHTQRTYEIEDISSAAKEIGFKINKYFCDFELDNKDYENANRIIFILEK